MPKKEVIVVAVITSRKGSEKALEAELHALIPPTRAESACINYDLHRSQDNPCVFMFHETWKSREDLDKHLATPHIARFRKNIADLVDGPADIRVYGKIG